ncbi:LysE family translocator [Sphingomonas crocodyli]|uniref:LysE family translocator n=1 Tax=Sphingomonas crocodyli TaxID=1979270 RepID=A0A437M9A5_9SPHN|nr:LysE family translocator [Sphingomonas crocodyli]RVT94084.1 LysE family translocator [Sphingomonas crocodyli]
MTPELLAAAASFCIVSSGTPGPNNMMLLSSGATFGFRRTLPHVFGISAGCVVMVLLLGFGLAGLIESVPWLYTALHIVSTAYLLWLAYKIATSTGLGEVRPRAQPLGFWGAAAFQWVNPKAWAMCLGAATSFSRPETLTTDVLIVAAVLGLTGLPCIMCWAGGGVAIRHWLDRPGLLRAFNIGMAALLVASLVPGIVELITSSLRA